MKKDKKALAKLDDELNLFGSSFPEPLINVNHTFPDAVVTKVEQHPSGLNTLTVTPTPQVTEDAESVPVITGLDMANETRASIEEQLRQSRERIMRLKNLTKELKQQPQFDNEKLQERLDELENVVEEARPAANYNELTPHTLSMSTLHLVILGEPKGQKRHRSAMIGKGTPKAFITNYDPSAKDKKNFAQIVQENAPKVPFEGPLRLDVHAYFTRPKSHYRTGKNAHILREDAPTWKTSKPDRDNVDKFVLDALSKIYWKDDAMICAGEILKRYSDKPRLEIFLTPLRNQD